MTSERKDKPKSLVVWNYEILLVLTGLFSLWNYGSISLMTMGERDSASTGAQSNTSAYATAGSGSAENGAVAAPLDADAFVFTVMATGAAITILALLRFVFRAQFSRKLLHSPLLLLVFSIPIIILGGFIGLMFGLQAANSG